MYSPKRAAFTLAGMLARSLLAIIDHNHHLHRPYSFDKDNNQIVLRVWSKRAKRWKVFLVKAAKNYSYLPLLHALVLRFREQNQAKVHSKRTKPDNHPTNIQPTIASLPPKSSKELYKEALSRF